jgi:hypothetical protein
LKLRNTFLSNPWFKEEIKTEIVYYPESNEKKKTPHQSLWATAKAVLRGHLIAFNAFIIFVKVCTQIIVVNSQLNKLDKEL